MKIYKIIAVIFLLTIISEYCFAQYMRLSAPIKQGNVWVYIADSGFDKILITDSVIVIDSVDYSFVTFIPQRGIFWGNGKPVRLKWNDDVVVRLDSTYPDINHEFIYYKKNCKIGDTWTRRNSRFSTSITYEVVDTSLANIFGTITTVKTIYVTNGLIVDYEFWSEKFGFLQNSSPFGGTDHKLKGCIIDGVLYGDTTTITDVEEELLGISVAEYKLSQNYPNPFNPETKINYEVPQISNVKIEVFDVLGRVIKILIDEEKTAGRYEIKFDASSLASGIYYYRIKADEFVQTKKMILMK